MQQTSALYRSILASNNHWFESSLVIGETGRLMTEIGNVITFGGTSIMVARGGGDSGFQESQIISMSITSQVFAGSTPSIGNAIAGEIEVEMLNPVAEIPRMAQMIPYVRVTNGTQTSEWIKKGVFFIDTREVTGTNNKTLTLHGYDAMLLADNDYDYTRLNFPVTDVALLQDIASIMEIAIDPRTLTKMNKGYSISLPAGYTMRELLGYLAGMYCGNMIINEQGALRLVSINEMPGETRYLITNAFEPITFGGDRILV